MAPPRKQSAGKRDTVKARNATFYAKCTQRGRFKAMDEKGWRAGSTTTTRIIVTADSAANYRSSDSFRMTIC